MLRKNNVRPEPLIETFERSLTKNDLLSSTESKNFIDDYTMPSLPMKFSFNKIYIQPLENSQIDLSLKSIFSKNANKEQLLARKRFLIKIGAVSGLCILLLIGIIVLAVVLATRKDPKNEATTTTTKSPSSTPRPELTFIKAPLVNDLIEMNDRTLVSSTIDGYIYVWDIYTYPINPTAKLFWQSSDSPVVIVKLSENTLISGSLDIEDALKIWDSRSGMLILTINEASFVKSICLVNDTYLLSGHQDSTVQMWDLENLNKISTFTGNGGDVNKIVLLDQPDQIAVVYNFGLAFWNILTGTQDVFLNVIDIKDVIQINSDYVIYGKQDEIVFYRLSTGVDDGIISLPGEDVSVLMLLSDSEFLAGSSTDLKLFKYEIVPNEPSGEVMAEITNAHANQVNSLISIAWKNRIVSASTDGYIKFWKKSDLISVTNS